MLSQVDWRKVATGSGVLLLHLLLVLVLLTTTGIVPLRNLGNPREIMLTLAPPKAPRRQEVPQPRIEEQIPVPNVIQPILPPSHAITAPPPAPTQPNGDTTGLGRYLFNCSGAYYEELTPREKEHCLRNRWNGQKPAEQEPVLGPSKPSPFDQVIIERNKDAQPIAKPCPLGSVNSNLGIPCYDFSGHHLLEEVPEH